MKTLAKYHVCDHCVIGEKTFQNTVEPLYYGQQGDRDKCPHYRGVRFREVGFIWILVSQGPSELSVIERCPY